MFEMKESGVSIGFAVECLVEIRNKVGGKWPFEKSLDEYIEYVKENISYILAIEVNIVRGSTFTMLGEEVNVEQLLSWKPPSPKSVSVSVCEHKDMFGNPIPKKYFERYLFNTPFPNMEILWKFYRERSLSEKIDDYIASFGYNKEVVMLYTIMGDTAVHIIPNGTSLNHENAYAVLDSKQNVIVVTYKKFVEDNICITYHREPINGTYCVLTDGPAPKCVLSRRAHNRHAKSTYDLFENGVIINIENISPDVDIREKHFIAYIPIDVFDCIKLRVGLTTRISVQENYIVIG